MPRQVESAVILVVEDEAIIRMATAQLLQDAGFEVVVAKDADIALQVLESRSDINFVFTDIKMPGSLCGLRLANAIRDRWPPIHLIIASGLEAPTEEEIPRIARFIPKPYAPKHLLRAIHELSGLNPTPYRYIENIIQNYGMLAHR